LVLVVHPSVPAKSVQQLIALLNDHIVRAVRSPELAQRFAYEGVEVVASSPAQLASHIKAELARWAKVVKESESLRAD
jgi:tripartite-type tricarboxylate transporter receptor subunit TctC